MLVAGKSAITTIDRRQIWRNIGYRAASEPPGRISSLIDEYIENTDQLIEPGYSYVIKNIESVRGDVVNVGDSIVFESEVIARLLER